MSLLDRARAQLMSKTKTETDYHILIGGEYQKVRNNTNNCILYLKNQIKHDPEYYDKAYKNLESFAREKYNTEKRIKK